MLSKLFNLHLFNQSPPKVVSNPHTHKDWRPLFMLHKLNSVWFGMVWQCYLAIFMFCILINGILNDWILIVHIIVTCRMAIAKLPIVLLMPPPSPSPSSNLHQYTIDLNKFGMHPTLKKLNDKIADSSKTAIAQYWQKQNIVVAVFTVVISVKLIRFL